jgi:hypothetical protein
MDKNNQQKHIPLHLILYSLEAVPTFTLLFLGYNILAGFTIAISSIALFSGASKEKKGK